MAKENTDGKTADAIVVITNMIRSMALELIHGQMDANT